MGWGPEVSAYINAEMDAGDSTKENLRIESDQYQTRIMKK
jgi:hypothetical protein